MIVNQYYKALINNLFVFISINKYIVPQEKALRLQALAKEQQKVSLQNRQRTEQLERSLLARPKFHAKRET